MPDKMQQAIAAYQQGIIAAAEQKLGRVLTDAERRGIQSIGSLMLLESCYQSFRSPIYTQAQVRVDLDYFTRQT